ncbi:MAG: formylglycine-generating enzyme family protein [Paludibacteraceae bacterium]|nr:formylglycine-generating enzyme family protein [Paludibacteraceae bacterium]
MKRLLLNIAVLTAFLSGISSLSLAETFTVNGVSFNMVSVSGGTFKMGAQKTSKNEPNYDEDAGEDELPVRDVTLSAFSIAETEVTQELYQAVMGKNPSFHKGAKLPVEQVSWYDCQKFIEKLNALTGQHFRLPTEAEWEYAARGGHRSRHRFKYAGNYSLDAVGWYHENSDKETHPVAQKEPNELGIYDMSGNVWEWCADFGGAYAEGAQVNPKGPADGDNRVCRGGCFPCGAHNCRVSNRMSSPPNYRRGRIGFRIVK